MTSPITRSSTELWGPIPGHGGYEASTWGRIRSLDRVVTYRTGAQRAYRGQVLRQATNAHSGVRTVNLSRKKIRVGVAVLSTFVGPRPVGLECCHRDDDQSNNYLVNLRWDTSAENKLDITRNGNNVLANRTHCPLGHVLVTPNLTRSSARERRRRCLACSRARGLVKRRRIPVSAGELQLIADSYFAALWRAA